MPVLRTKSANHIHLRLSKEAQNWAQLTKGASLSLYGFRHGIAHLISTDNASVGRTMLEDISYIVERLTYEKDASIEAVRDDAMVVIHMLSEAEQSVFTDWVAFYKSNSFALSQADFSAHKAFIQLAVGYAENSPVTQAAEAWLQENNSPWLWLRPAKRPTFVPSELMGVVSFPQGHPGGVVRVGENKAMLFAEKSSSGSVFDEPALRLVAIPSLHKRDYSIAEETITNLFPTVGNSVLIYGAGYLQKLHLGSGVLSQRISIPSVKTFARIRGELFWGVSPSCFFIFDAQKNTIVLEYENEPITDYAMGEEKLWVLLNKQKVSSWSLSDLTAPPQVFSLDAPCTNIHRGANGYIVFWTKTGTLYVKTEEECVDLSFDGTITGLTVSDLENIVIWSDRLFDIDVQTREVRIAPEVHSTQVVLAGEIFWGIHQRSVNRIYRVGIQTGVRIQGNELLTTGRYLFTRDRATVEACLIVRWCLRTLQPLTTYPYHPLVGEGAHVTGLQIWNEEKLVIVGRRQVQVRDVKDGQLYGSLRLPDYAKVHVLLRDGLIITALDDMNVHYWNGSSKHSTQLVGQEDDLISAQHLGGQYCSTFDRYSKEVRFWKLNDADITPVWAAHRIGGVGFFCTKDGHLFSCSNDNQLLQWDLNTYSHTVVIENIKGRQGGAVGSSFYTKYHPPNILVVWGGGATSSCYFTPHVWNMKSGALITILRSREEGDRWVPDNQDVLSQPILSQSGGIFPKKWVQERPMTPTDGSRSAARVLEHEIQPWTEKNDLGVSGGVGLEICSILDDGLAVCAASNGDVRFYHLYKGNARVRPEEWIKMQIKIQLPQEESKNLELTGAITVAELDALFSSAGVVFWIVNGYPAGRENLLFEGDNVIGIDQVKANHRGRPYTWGAYDFPFLRSSSEPNLFSPPETHLEKPNGSPLSREFCDGSW